jgi:small ubiquitin-related modifier|mmetsp:Transcript_73082/g.123151  ORF Transcript_73082/g.123151 Transcript_73082/m.123151 type:complete len:93 (-) Transcript_73082:639-917(-)|eukprot:CAMPEP_0174286500 /NCGR_PEP_ID=MMETSP0809-20121228/12178_1 /TAXON_ID=73025 ORGANISM="Eutreptiella gymnastica-like, Strain CCMP1594" /NCGR_SAMPLE_ID=MMETSP0809 /ASSEMBLY_ACC=CAM_ASM_000658 /LENGTH=92 /DNA_ID=CAMNT_0015382605 /DNA_START=63 /DNA_END=341 /DNA_ORIENTATION=-
MADEQAPKTEGDTQQISIKVVNAEGAEVYFKIKRSTPLRKLMDAYCKKQGINRTSVRFHFDGRRIEDEKTAEDYEMEDDDVIDAMVEQTGGF